MRRSPPSAGLAFALLMLLAPFGAAAQDLARGKLLYETQCNECHYERVHERLKSDVKDLADLRETVRRWAQRTRQRSFSADELDDVVEYLNASHYRFGASGTRQR